MPARVVHGAEPWAHELCNRSARVTRLLPETRDSRRWSVRQLAARNWACAACTIQPPMAHVHAQLEGAYLAARWSLPSAARVVAVGECVVELVEGQGVRQAVVP